MMDSDKRTLRQGCNDVVQNAGNVIFHGLGDLLTKDIKVSAPLTVAGTIGAPLTYAHFLCQHMYDTGVVDRMYSSDISERLMGSLESTGYTFNWMIMLPITAYFGAKVLHGIGQKIDSI